MQAPDSPVTSSVFPLQFQAKRRKRRAALALVCSLATTGGLTGAIWLGQAAIAPPIVQAYTSRVDVSIDNLPGETYETLLRRAETVARAAAQRSFDRDILITEVSIVVTAQNQGATAPLLTLEASRAQWRSFPDPRRWSTYYRSARFLLGFEKPTTPTTPVSTPTVQTSPTPGAPPAEPSATPTNATPPGTAPGAPTTPAAPAGTTPVAPAGTTPVAPAGTTPAAPAGTTPAAPAGTTPAAPTTVPTTPVNTPAPPTTPGTPGSTPAPGTQP